MKHNEYAVAGIAYSDYHFMGTEKHAGHNRANAPAWVFNDKEVSRVIATKIKGMVFAAHLPENIIELHEMDRTAIAGLAASSCKESKQGAASARRVGSLSAMWAAVLYRYFRQGQTCVQVAQSLGLSPTCVRQMIFRLKQFQASLAAGRTFRRGRSQIRRIKK